MLGCCEGTENTEEGHNGKLPPLPAGFLWRYNVNDYIDQLLIPSFFFSINRIYLHHICISSLAAGFKTIINVNAVPNIAKKTPNMPCKSTTTPSEILNPSEIPIHYFENFVRLRYQSENSIYFQSIGKQRRALNMASIKRLERDIMDHFGAMRRKNEMFGVYDV